MGYSSGPDEAENDIKKDNDNNQNNDNQDNNNIIKQKERKEITIVVLGETGTGKSTFFNSIINYLNNDGLLDALKVQDRDSLYKIPVRINIWGKDETEYNFQVGKIDKNVKPGESLTKLCTTYTVEIGDDIAINFIDTPGIGDTRGVNADAQNFEKILNELSVTKELHGILILLNPSSDRLTITFRYVINELFTRLHESARNNLFFVFTKTRGTMFKPGSSLSILKQHLANLKINTGIEITTDGRYFCLDNEAFSYLMAKKFTDAQFDEGDQECYETSWDKSSKVVYKIIETITKLPPHKVSDSLCINNARAMINKSKYPLMQCMNKVEKTINIIQEYNIKLEQCEDNYGKLKRLLFKNVPRVELSPLPNPFIFCNHSECVNDTNTIVLDKGKVDGHICVMDDKDLTPSSWLYFRKSMNIIGNCKKCSHSLSYHSIEITAQFKNEVRVLDQDVKDKIEKEKENIDQLKLKKIKMLKEELYELEYTKNVLVWALLKFSIFLNNHSLVPVNQEYKEYIEQEIKIKESEGNKESVEKLYENLEDYDYIVKQIKEIKANPYTTTPTPEEVFEIIKRVENLKIISEFFTSCMHVHSKVLLLEHQPSQSDNSFEIKKITKLLKAALSNWFK